MNLSYRQAQPADIPLLARMNQDLRDDEQSHWQLTLPQLEDRMRTMLSQGYTAVLFELDTVPVAFALYRPTEGGAHLRQFFVERAYRRQGIGREAIGLLLTHIWPPQTRITLDVLSHNQTGYAFWQSLGFRDYAITLERLPDTTT